MACCSSSALVPHYLRPPSSHRRLFLHPKTLTTANLSSMSLSDPFVLDIANKLEDSLSSTYSLLQKLHESSSPSLLSRRWPSPKDESFRFTDTSFLKSSQILPSSPPSINPRPSSTHASNLLTVVDGRIVPSLSCLPSLPTGAFAGSAADISIGSLFETVHAAAVERFRDGDLFWDLNGFGAPDMVVVYIPDGERMIEDPLHLRFCAAEAAEVGSGRMPLSSPRVLVVAGKRAELAIVEEHVGVENGEGSSYWSNSVVEILMEEGAKVSHSYVQMQSLNAAHTKWTYVRQITDSLQAEEHNKDSGSEWGHFSTTTPGAKCEALTLTDICSTRRDTAAQAVGAIHASPFFSETYMRNGMYSGEIYTEWQQESLRSIPDHYQRKAKAR